MRIFLSLVFAALLSGCASSPSMSSMLTKIGEFNREMLHEEDAQTADAIRLSFGAVSLRTSRLDDKPRTVSALVAACYQGRWVELLTHSRASAQAQSIRQACTQVYVSADPRLLDSQDVLVLEGQRMWVEGRKVSASRKQLEDEFVYWQVARRTASYQPRR